VRGLATRWCECPHCGPCIELLRNQHVSVRETSLTCHASGRERHLHFLDIDGLFSMRASVGRPGRTVELLMGCIPACALLSSFNLVLAMSTVLRLTFRTDEAACLPASENDNCSRSCLFTSSSCSQPSQTHLRQSPALAWAPSASQAPAPAHRPYPRPHPRRSPHPHCPTQLPDCSP
jgi:hypothetical protein